LAERIVTVEPNAAPPADESIATHGSVCLNGPSLAIVFRDYLRKMGQEGNEFAH
jgi:hypothetical protein